MSLMRNGNESTRADAVHAVTAHVELTTMPKVPVVLLDVTDTGPAKDL